MGRLRPRIFSTFGTTRVVGRQLYAPAAFTPGEIPGTPFQRLSRPQGTWICRKEPRKKSPVTLPGIDPGTVRLVAQRLNHYATPGPTYIHTYIHTRAKIRNG
jgi:phosphoribulokinase